MSPFFVKMFRRQHRCLQCRAAQALPKKVVPGRKRYSLCERHLVVAAEQWRCWAYDRQSQGLCVQCNRRGAKKDTTRHYGTGLQEAPTEQRCRVHKEVSRLRVKRWFRDPQNKARHDKQQRLRVEALLNSGFCRCADHSPLREGERRCDACRRRHWQYKHPGQDYDQARHVSGRAPAVNP